MQFSADDNGIKDANGNTTNLIYDDRRRVTQLTNVLGEETHYTYRPHYACFICTLSNRQACAR